MYLGLLCHVYPYYVFHAHNWNRGLNETQILEYQVSMQVGILILSSIKYRHFNLFMYILQSTKIVGIYFKVFLLH